jgi:collagen type VI alpha
VNAPNIAIVITDGNSNINPAQTPDRAIEARTAGIHLMVVAVGTTFVNYGELEAIASQPTESNIFNVAHYEDLETIVEDLVLSTCDGKVVHFCWNNLFDCFCFTDVNECDPNPCQNGGRCIDGLRTYTCLCTNNYAGVNCDRCKHSSTSF